MRRFSSLSGLSGGPGSVQHFGLPEICGTLAARLFGCWNRRLEWK